MFSFVKKKQKKTTKLSPTSNGWKFFLVHILTRVLDLGHSNSCVLVSHYCHNLSLFNDMWCEASFVMLIYLPCIIFTKVLRPLAYFLIEFFLFVFILLSFRSSWSVLDNSPLSIVSFANFFTQSVACFLILLTLSFLEKFLIVMKSSLSSISFIDCAFGVVTKKSSRYSR